MQKRGTLQGTPGVFLKFEGSLCLFAADGKNNNEREQDPNEHLGFFCARHFAVCRCRRRGDKGNYAL